MTWREAFQITETFRNMHEATEAFAFNAASVGFIGGYLTTRHCPDGHIRLYAFYDAGPDDRHMILPDGCRWVLCPTPRPDLGLPEDGGLRYPLAS